jgi:hypothetical protein
MCEVLVSSRSLGVSASLAATLLTAVRGYLDVAEGEEAFIIATLVAAVSKALIAEEPDGRPRSTRPHVRDASSTEGQNGAVAFPLAANATAAMPATVTD